MPSTLVQTVDELIKALGGPKAAGDLLGGTSQMVVNWRTRGQLPARMFLSQQHALATRDIDAPPSLWGMDEPAEATQ